MLCLDKLVRSIDTKGGTPMAYEAPKIEQRESVQGELGHKGFPGKISHH